MEGKTRKVAEEEGMKKYIYIYIIWSPQIFEKFWLISKEADIKEILFIYRVIIKSVKHFKNSQQIDCTTDHGNSYADRERNSPKFVYWKVCTDNYMYKLFNKQI
jgi:hypothetical protein